MSSIPQTKWLTPTVNHDKIQPYVDFPVVHNATVSNEAFYVDYPWTFATTDLANTTLYKWCDSSWVEVVGLNAVDVVDARGWFSITTAANASVIVTEHLS